MFDIGFQELVIIFFVALLVFGPEKLPEIGKTLGKWMIEIRKGIHNAKAQMETEFEEAEKKAAEKESGAVAKEEGKPADEADSDGKKEQG